MSLSIRGAALPVVTGLSHLNRWNELRTLPYFGDAQALALWDGQVIGKWTGLGNNVNLPVWNVGQGQAPQVDAVDGVRCLRLRPGPSTGVGTVAHYRSAFLSKSGAADRLTIPFSDVAFPRILQPGSDFGKPLAVVMEAWVRKFNNVDPTHACMCFGFQTQPGNVGTDRGVSLGLIGDGATGFRFGSISAPDGNGAFGNTASNRIDANALQPADLVNPGLNWFLVRLKMIPAQAPGVPGSWFAYLHGARVGAGFTTLANFPRGDTGVNRNYGFIVPSMYAGCSDGGAGQQVSGYYLAEWRMWFDEDLTA